MPAEQFVINIITTGDKEAVAAQGRVAASSREMGAAAKGASAASAGAAASTAQKWSNAGSTATAAGKKMNRGLTLPILAIGAVTGKMAVDFEKSMRNVNSIAQLPEKQFQRVNKQVLDMAGRTAQAPITLSEGLYDLVSSGFKAGEAINVLESSAKAATAGLTTTEVSTKAVAAALNAYHLPASKAQSISDDLFQTVNLGVVSFDELASTIGYVLPAASTMGVDLKQVGASIATLTKQGQSGSNAVTNINAALTSFIKPSKAMKGVLKELGYETSKQLITQKGFQGAVEAVSKAVGGGEEAIGELFPNVRAMRAVFGLTGEAAESAGKDIRGFQNDTGATAKVLHEQQKSLAYQWSELKAEASTLAIEVGGKLIPIFSSLAKDVMGAVKWFGALPEGVQSTTLKLLAFGAVMGPILTIGGNFAKMIGGITGAVRALLATEFVAAISTFGLEGLAVWGGAAASSLMAGLAAALPIAAAGAGIVNILSSVITGDSKGAMEKTGGAIGGALIGGIAGSFIPGIGTLIGAAVGGGAGSFLGPMIADLFDSEKKLGPLQQRLIDSGKGLSTAMHSEREAAKSLSQGNKHLADAKHRQRRATDNVKDAEQRLTHVLKTHKHNTMPVLQAELELARAKHKNAKASDAVKNAEKLQGYERKIQMPILRTSMLEARHRVNVLKDERTALRKQGKALAENGGTEKERTKWIREARKNSDQLSKAEKKKNEILSDATRLIGPRFAKALQNASREQLKLVNSVQSQGKTVKQHYSEMSEAVFGFSRTAEHTQVKVKGSYEKMKGVLGPFRTEASRQMGKATTDVWGFAKGTGTAFKTVEESTNTALTNLGVKQVTFGITTPTGGRKKARGGVMRVAGQGRDDTVPLTTSTGIHAVVAPGEDLAVINRHQRPELDWAVRMAYGDQGLNEFFQRNNRPHNFARGGLVEPRMSGPDPMQDAGQNAIHAVTKAAIAYIKKQGGDKTVKAVINEGNRMDGLKQPYLWGGGHGSTPSHNGPWDCSGGISQLLYGAGWKDLSPMVSGGFSSWGEEGKGAISILSNPEHVYGVVEGKGAIGTSGENPGGGFGWISGYTFRPGFTTTHADVAGEGMPTAPRRGKGQRLKKGFAEGGWVKTGYTIYSGSGQGAGGNLQSGKGYAELGTATSSGQATGSGYAARALGMSGELPMGYALDIKIGGKEATLYKKDRGYGQGTPAYSIDIHSLAWGELGLGESNGKGSAFIRPGDGSAAGGKAETVPAVFHGARTKTLDFPDMPKTLHGVNKEIGKWQSRLSTYKTAARKAKGKPKTEQAILKNIAAIENWLTQLRRQRALLRRKAAMKKVSKKLRRKLGKITGAERSIEEAERIYTIADQTAQQVVGLEPQQPELKADATAEERDGAEKRYVQDFKNYVEQQERPAYMTVLDALASWRNTTIGGEGTASRLETGWEKEVRTIDHEIDGINAFTEKVAKDKAGWKAKHPKADFPDWIKDEIKKDHQQRSRLPVLRFRDREVRKTLGEARDAFYPGRKDPVQPPAVPMAGTGSIEDVLTNIQGTHWPDQHARLPASALGPPRRAGTFGGAVWDTQGSIEELGLKINQVANGIGSTGGNESDANSEHTELVEQENLELKRAALVSAAQAPVLANYLGAYGKGGKLPEDGFYYGHAGEEITQRDQTGQDGDMSLEAHIYLDGAVALDDVVDARVELRDRNTGRKAGMARASVSVPGRKAAMTQGRKR